ncbi:MAG: PilZ domain-containing protein [Myxococcales bacterium]|nr:MAG: PilZ domain-containing protein [Myxococcales bacterium]
MTHQSTKPGPRQSARLTINKEFSSLDSFVQEYITNISKHGVFIRSDNPPPVGTEVNLNFTVMVDGLENIEGIGQVVRVQNDPPGVGVVFTKLSSYSSELIERLLTTHQ